MIAITITDPVTEDKIDRNIPVHNIINEAAGFICDTENMEIVKFTNTFFAETIIFNDIREYVLNGTDIAINTEEEFNTIKEDIFNKLSSFIYNKYMEKAEYVFAGDNRGFVTLRKAVLPDVNFNIKDTSIEVFYLEHHVSTFNEHLIPLFKQALILKRNYHKELEFIREELLSAKIELLESEIQNQNHRNEKIFEIEKRKLKDDFENLIYKEKENIQILTKNNNILEKSIETYRKEIITVENENISLKNDFIEQEEQINLIKEELENEILLVQNKNEELRLVLDNVQNEKNNIIFEKNNIEEDYEKVKLKSGIKNIYIIFFGIIATGSILINLYLLGFLNFLIKM